MRRPRGAVNVVNLTLTAAVLSGGYLGWLYVPLWLDDLDVREALAAGVSQLTAEASGLDAPGVQKMVASRLSKVGYHWAEQDGREVQVPGLVIDPEDVQVERAADGRSARVTLEYARTVKLQPLERYWTLRFRTTREGSIR